tara:strand:- start:347 stop:526 length:180 start_codon:yes stop_codon:yes gene_type:complete
MGVSQREFNDLCEDVETIQGVLDGVMKHLGLDAVLTGKALWRYSKDMKIVPRKKEDDED